MTPIRKNILFKPFPGDEVSEAGIVVPLAFRKPSNRGVIVAAGNLCTKVKAGDEAFRVKGWGTEVLVNGELHFLMEEAAIIAKEEK